MVAMYHLSPVAFLCLSMFHGNLDPETTTTSYHDLILWVGKFALQVNPTLHHTWCNSRCGLVSCACSWSRCCADMEKERTVFSCAMTFPAGPAIGRRRSSSVAPGEARSPSPWSGLYPPVAFAVDTVEDPGNTLLLWYVRLWCGCQILHLSPQLCNALTQWLKHLFWNSDILSNLRQSYLACPTHVHFFIVQCLHFPAFLAALIKLCSHANGLFQRFWYCLAQVHTQITAPNVCNKTVSCQRITCARVIIWISLLKSCPKSWMHSTTLPFLSWKNAWFQSACASGSKCLCKATFTLF